MKFWRIDSIEAGSFKVIDDTEVSDLESTLCDFGRPSREFELAEIVTGLEEGVAVIRCIKSGVARHYRIGNGTTFPADFAVELARGFFM